MTVTLLLTYQKYSAESFIEIVYSVNIKYNIKYIFKK